MKYLFLLFFLASCTTPQIISPLDKNGNPIHSVLKEPFFGSPSQPSEWSFWYVIICMIALWFIWKEIRKFLIKTPTKSEDK
jgi:hypothetical protein